MIRVAGCIRRMSVIAFPFRSRARTPRGSAAGAPAGASENRVGLVAGSALDALADDRADLQERRIGDRVDSPRAVLAAVQERRAVQHREVLAHVRLRAAHLVEDLADGGLAPEEPPQDLEAHGRSEEHTSELQSLR